jgi:DNA polymerase III subunit chi
LGPVTEVSFYHLQRQPLEAVLPTLLLKARERGWRAVVQGTSDERVAALDDHLWTFSDETFLPHGREGDGDPNDHPVLLTLSGANLNGAQIRFLVEGAPFPDDAAAYDRLMVLFDGNDEDALGAAREQWRAVKAAGHDATSWQQDARGRWEKKA